MTISIPNIRRAAALAVAFVAISSAAAFAGDIAGRASTQTPAAPSYNWSGFYVGGNVGGAFQRGGGTSNFFQNDIAPLDDNFRSQSAGGDSVIGGLHAGYNWQFAARWVVGVEGDWQWIKSESSACRQTDRIDAACNDFGRGFSTVSGETRSIATVRGRFGWTSDSVMIYGTGGFAFADVRTSLGVSCLIAGCGNDNTPIATTVNSSTTKTGWAAGAGVEWMVGPNWTIRAEYLRIDLGSLSDTLNLPANAFSPNGVSWSRDLRYDVVRTGLSYKFNSWN